MLYIYINHIKSMINVSKQIVLIDALNLFARHYIVNPSISIHGTHIGGVVGFLNSIKDLSSLLLPKQIIVVWEAGGSNRKRHIFKDYKSGRKPPKLNRYYEDDLPDSKENRIEQIKIISNVLKCLGVDQIFVEGCEADDVIGFLCKNSFFEEKKIIASSDKDFYQLLDKNTMIYSFTTKSFIGHDDIVKKYNILPENFSIAKALCGDRSDSIPGIKGVGFKTLAKKFDLLTKQIMLSDIFDYCKDTKSNSKIYKNIIENKDLILRNLKLVHLDSSNISHIHVRQIMSAVENKQTTKNKIAVMKVLHDVGMQSYDVHELYSAINFNA